MAEKAKAEGNNFVKKLLSSNLTWSIVAFIFWSSSAPSSSMTSWL